MMLWFELWPSNYNQMQTCEYLKHCVHVALWTAAANCFDNYSDPLWLVESVYRLQMVQFI